MKVLIRAPNWVGDAVMAVPALREFRRMFADSEITLLARSWLSGLFAGEDLSDHIVQIEDRAGPVRSSTEFLRITRTLRTERFDIAILLQNAFSAALMARAGRARRVAGYPTDGRRRLLDLVIPFDADFKSSHQVFYYLRIASYIEEALKGSSRVNLTNPYPSLRVGPDAKERAWRMIEEANPDSGLGNHRSRGRVLAINPGATNSRAKRWLAERFAAAADLLAERDGFSAVIVGATGDIEAANETVRHMTTPATVLAGRTTVEELKAVLSCASLVLSNDTGAAHVSAALGIPTVVVFGPTRHVSTRPYSRASTVVRHDVECSPCMLRDCPIDHRCMTRIEVEDVYQAAKSLLVNV